MAAPNSRRKSATPVAEGVVGVLWPEKAAANTYKYTYSVGEGTERVIVTAYLGHGHPLFAGVGEDGSLPPLQFTIGVAAETPAES